MNLKSFKIFYTLKEAQKIAKCLNGEKDGLKYSVWKFAKNKAQVLVIDENGHVMGTF